MIGAHLHKSIMLPIYHFTGSGTVGSWASFLVSGIFHEWAYCAAFGVKTAPHIGWNFTFFITQALLTTLETKLEKHLERRYHFKLPWYIGWIIIQTLIITGPASFFFFHPLHHFKFTDESAQYFPHINITQSN